MNKTVLFAIGGVVSIVALVLLMQDDGIEMSSTVGAPEQKTVLSETPASDDVSIRYETHEAAAVTKKETQKRAVPREKYLESKTYDQSKRFEIALINKNLEHSRNPGGYTMLQGSIDGEPFFLKVPKKLIEEGSGVTKLRVTDLKTNGVSTVSAAFIDDMRNPMVRQRVDIDSKDLSNYQQHEVEAIVPPRPGEAVR